MRDGCGKIRPQVMRITLNQARYDIETVSGDQKQSTLCLYSGVRWGPIKVLRLRRAASEITLTLWPKITMTLTLTRYRHHNEQTSTQRVSRQTWKLTKITFRCRVLRKRKRIVLGIK
jgi:hypothetical protein